MKKMIALALLVAASSVYAKTDKSFDELRSEEVYTFKNEHALDKELKLPEIAYEKANPHASIFVSPVSEPDSYIMLIAGLAMILTIGVRRTKNKQHH